MSNKLTTEEWAKEVRARLHDLNELLEEATGRDVIVSGVIAMGAPFVVGGALVGTPFPTIDLTLSARI